MVHESSRIRSSGRPRKYETVMSRTISVRVDEAMADRLRRAFEGLNSKRGRLKADFYRELLDSALQEYGF
jgi:predicted DNA-binding protein